MLDRAVTAHDKVVREESTKASALQEVRNAMTALGDLFEKCNAFYTIEPSNNASATCGFIFENDAF